ncbi:hypothetical protein Thein_0880 [Thermodesulfatator indicus DSM 15286]|uniref:Helix-turn-helix domain-containing protein n=1 Tax=Thermodesulfatator indicus (strain DSM 15286 / JCM 11887 / CIR29812) TaxID=667014 RepID=F8A8B2_THEID|nr:helix-turn-helix domain-containing protein [Thermodesulfatator indicus]AEH44757.1 hypothetical protein Thein_0880 [Thermodesulfatator indicus DSM 15286]
MSEGQNKNGFGEYLRHQREIRGFSLEEISSQTRIGLRALKALEAEDWEILPAEIYIRGFIRSYCETIGLDPNEALIRFEEAYAPFRRHKTEKIQEMSYEKESQKEIPWRLIAILILVILLITGGYFLFFKEEKKSASQLAPLIEEIPLKKDEANTPKNPSPTLPKLPGSAE